MATPDPIARAAAWYRGLGSSNRASIAALLVANAIPIVGVAFLGWSLMTILVLYWLENGIVGLWTIPRIALARGTGVGSPVGLSPAAVGCVRYSLIPFFIVHYGLFWFVHGVFLLSLPLFASMGGGGPGTGFGEALGGDAPAFGSVDPTAVAFAALALVVSHGVSFFVNYLGAGESLRTTPQARMVAVYGRVVVLHLTILFGAFAAAILGGPIWILVILVVGKTALDLGLHAREHRSAGARGA